MGEKVFKNKKYDKILQYFGIKVKKDKDGMLILSEYRQPGDFIRFEDLKIDEDDLFKSVKEIKGNASFFGSNVTSLGNLQSIGGNANFGGKISVLGGLKSIGGDANFEYSSVNFLNVLESIGGDAWFDYSNILSLGTLQSIGGNVHIEKSSLKEDDFSNIKIGKQIIKPDNQS